MMVMVTTMSVLGSLMVWLGYHNFLESDSNHTSTTDARSLEEDFSPGQSKQHGKPQNVQSVPKLHTVLLDERAAKFLKEMVHNQQQTNSPQLQNIKSLPQVLLDAKVNNVSKDKIQDKQQAKISRVQSDPSLPRDLLDDRDILKENGQNKENKKISQVKNVSSSTPVQLVDMNQISIQIQNKEQTTVPLVQNVTSLPPVMVGNTSKILTDEIWNKEQTKTPPVQNVSGSHLVPLDIVNNWVLKVKETERETSFENDKALKVGELKKDSLGENKDLQVGGTKKDTHSHMENDKASIVGETGTDLRSFTENDKVLNVGDTEKDVDSHSEQLNIAEARFLLDLFDNYSSNQKPEVKTGFHDIFKKIPLEDKHSDSKETDALFEDNHTYKDDQLKVHEKLKTFKGARNEHQFSLLDVLKLPTFGGHKLPHLDVRKNPPNNSLYVLYSLASFVEYENAVENNPIVLESTTTEKAGTTSIPVVSNVPQLINKSTEIKGPQQVNNSTESKVPQRTNNSSKGKIPHAANKSTERKVPQLLNGSTESKVPQPVNKSTESEDDEVTSGVSESSVVVESLSDKYMSHLGWEARAAIGVSVVVIILLLASIIIFVTCYCKRRKRHMQHREKNVSSNEGT